MDFIVFFVSVFLFGVGDWEMVVIHTYYIPLSICMEAFDIVSVNEAKSIELGYSV